METPLFIGLVLISVAIVFNGLMRLRGKCVFGHSYAVASRGSKEVGFFRTYSTGQRVPNSEFKKTRIYTLYKCTKCSHEVGESRYHDDDNPEIEPLTVELARSEINKLNKPSTNQGGASAAPPNAISKSEVEAMINSVIKNNLDNKINDSICLVNLIPEKKKQNG